MAKKKTVTLELSKADAVFLGQFMDAACWWYELGKKREKTILKIHDELIAGTGKTCIASDELVEAVTKAGRENN
jgi:hypothetical protein